MAAHRQIDGAYQWELSIPPASAVALLSAVCVNLDDPNSHYVGHLLLGPKAWQLRFDGWNFDLRPLGRGNIYTIYGLTRGTIVPAKYGSRIELRLSGNEELRQGIWWLPIVFPPCIAIWLIALAPPAFPISLRILAALVTGWSVFEIYWLLPWRARRAYTDFVDELFADYLVRPETEHTPPATAHVAASAK